VKPQREHEAALLPFGCHLPRRLPIEKELKVIAMRTALRGPQQLVPGPVLRQQRRKRSFVRPLEIRCIRKPGRFGGRRNLRIGRAQMLRQRADAFGPQGDQADACRRQLRFERRQFRRNRNIGGRSRARPPGFEQAVSFCQGAVICLQGDEVFRVGRRQHQVEPAAPQRWRAAHEQLILRGEHHGWKPAHIVGQPGDSFLVAVNLLAVGAELDRNRRFPEPLVLQNTRDRSLGLPVRNHQARIRRTEGPQCREKTRRLQQTGLPLPVRADQELLAAIEGEARERDVAPVLDGEFAEMHAGAAPNFSEPPANHEPVCIPRRRSIRDD